MQLTEAPSFTPVYHRLLPWVLVTQLYWLSYKLLERRFYPLGVSVSQARVLSILHYSRRPVKPSVIATLLFQETQSITGILHRIESKGWVRREPDPEDRRAIGLELTESGRDLSEKIIEISEDLYEELFGVLNARDRAAIETVLRKVREHGLSLPETDFKLRRARNYEPWNA